MEHWHVQKGNVKAIKHSHPGGAKRHDHPRLKGYGRDRDSVTVKLRDLGAKAKKAATFLNPRLTPVAVIGYPFTDRLAREMIFRSRR